MLEPEARHRGSVVRFVQPNPTWLSSLEWTVVAALAVAFGTRTFLPAWQTLKSEFPNYYLAAKLYRNNIPLDRIYEWTWFQRQNDHWGVRDGLVSFSPNPPTLILASIPLAGLQPLAAKRVWLILSLASLALSVAILRRVTTLSWRRLSLITLLCMLPLNVDFLFARHYVVILTLVCASYYAASADRHGVSGAIWSVAAGMKLFPALVVIFFLCKRNVRALVGFLSGLTVLVFISVVMFGAEVHRVFLREVLSQASRGDWLGPYTVSQNSFTTLWSRLFLTEPELNPFPLVNSPLLFASALAISVAALFCVFLWLVEDDRATRTTALQWGAFVPLMLLFSTTTAPDYWCLMIFSAIVGVDALLGTGNKGSALILLLLYVAACAPLPARISSWFPMRLLATTALFVWLLHCARAFGKRPSGGRWLAAGLILAGMLTFCNLQWVRNREEDFNRRLPTLGSGYRFANPVPAAGGVAYTEMLQSRYAVGIVRRGAANEVSLSGDALSLAGSSKATALYSELTTRESLLVELPVDQPGSSPERLTEGQEPTLSSNGKWLAFIREDHGRRTAWLQELRPGGAPQTIVPSAYQPLDLTVTNDGDVIAAAGNVSDPSLLRFVRNTREVSPLSGFLHPARYPSISPDGQRLAFCRRDHGSWHLYVRDVATGSEQQLTHAWCNALSPSWADTQTLLYATDCGRGVGLTTIARVVLPE
jgi:Glycosyltransferase family 87/WD40-like Beta Propeller Repeat